MVFKWFLNYTKVNLFIIIKIVSFAFGTEPVTVSADRQDKKETTGI